MTRRRVKSRRISSKHIGFLSFIRYYFKIFSVLVITSTFIFYIASFPESSSYFTDRSKSEVKIFSFTSNITAGTYSHILSDEEELDYMDLEDVDEEDKELEMEQVDLGETHEENEDIDEEKDKVEENLAEETKLDKTVDEEEIDILENGDTKSVN